MPRFFIMNFLSYIKNPITSTDILNAVDRVVLDNERILVELQTDQWSEGKDKFGSVIGRYKPFTESISKQNPFPNKPKVTGQPYNLDWSGELKRGLFVNTRRLSSDILVQIDSSGNTLGELFSTIENHGLIDNPNTIFGYQQKRKDIVVRLITSKTLSKLKTKIR